MGSAVWKVEDRGSDDILQPEWFSMIYSAASRKVPPRLLLCMFTSATSPGDGMRCCPPLDEFLSGLVGTRRAAEVSLVTAAPDNLSKGELLYSDGDILNLVLNSLEYIQLIFIRICMNIKVALKGPVIINSNVSYITSTKHEMSGSLAHCWALLLNNNWALCGNFCMETAFYHVLL